MLTASVSEVTGANVKAGVVGTEQIAVVEPLIVAVLTLTTTPLPHSHAS